MPKYYHGDFFSTRIEEVENSILNLADWVGQSRQRPAGIQGLERRIAEIFGISFHGPLYSMSLPDQLWADFCTESQLQMRGENGTETDLKEAVTNRFLRAWTLARTMAVAYWDILELYDVVIPDAWRFFREISSRIFSYGIVNLGEAWCKYQTSYLLAKSLENEPPPRPSWFPWAERDGFLLGGPTMRRLWCHLVLRHHKKDISLAYSLYQAKKVAPEISPLLIQEALDKNLSLLTEERPLEDEGNDVTDLCYEVRRTVRELCNLPTAGVGIQEHPFPSLSACYERPKYKGGALEELVPANPLKSLLFKELLCYLSFENRYTPVYRIPVEESDFSIYYRNLSGSLHVRRHAIAEPFKVRVVSMGSAEKYQMAKGFQKMLWELMHRSPVFDLTHRPCEVGDVASVARWLSISTSIHSLMVSGDYTSATDNLHPELSEACLEELMIQLDIPWNLRPTLMTCLTRHTIVDEEGVQREQTWGQLMGSPISFPILSICNCAVTRHVMENQFGMFIPLRYDAGGICPLKVNGDDILFPLPPAGYREWYDTVSRAGLSPSVGKNYVSRRIAVINSEMYSLDPDWDRGREEVEKIPYINLGLMRLVQDRGRGDDTTAFVSDRFTSTLRERLLSAIEGFDITYAERIIQYTLSYNRPLLSRVPPVSWWVAECYGGLGLPSTRQVVIAEHHLKLAAAFLMVDQRLIWSLRHPRTVSDLTVFSQMTESYLGKVLDELQVPWQFLPQEQYGNPEDSVVDVVTPKITRGFTAYGAGHELTSVHFLRKWAAVYRRWMKILRKNWIIYHPMDPEKAKIDHGHRWIRHVKRSSSQGFSGPVSIQEASTSRSLLDDFPV